MKNWKYLTSTIMGCVVLTSGPALPLEAAPKQPVIVELFTSEGCSSCPPADKALHVLQKLNPAAVDIIVISEHVDYWNNLGWKDPYSSPVFTERQYQYARSLGESGVYTPQMIVDGRKGFVGSQLNTAIQAIGDAAREEKKTLRVDGLLDSNNRIVNVNFPAGRPALSKNELLVCFITEDGLSSAVSSGENGGNVLQHTAVARAVRTMETNAAAPLQMRLKYEKAENLRIIAIVQNKLDRTISAIGQARVR